MNIIYKRHFYLYLLLALGLGLIILFGSLRIISYNFGSGKSVELKGKNYDNEIYLYDDTLIHEIEIGLNQADYDEMVRTYQETGEKEFYRTFVTIDGVTIPDVGVRLKGNLTLRQTLGGSGNGQQMPGQGGFANNKNFPENIENRMDRQMPGNIELPADWDNMSDEELQTYMEENGIKMPVNRPDFANGDRPGMGGMAGGQMPGVMNMDSGNGSNPPFLIKIDEFIDGQSYQGFAEISVRIGSDASLLSEPISFYIHSELGQIVPETAYAVVQTAENEPSLYVICEHLDENYVDKNFPGENGTLYKAGNFVGFSYLGEDPTLYANYYEQKTNETKDDLAPLIDFLRFVHEASDEEFAKDLSKWLDIDSFVRMMALDNLLSNNDSFGGMGSNYYLYYDKNDKQFTILSWDLNMAMGVMGGNKGARDMQEKTENIEILENSVVVEEEIEGEVLNEISNNVEKDYQANQVENQANQVDDIEEIEDPVMQAWLAEGGFGEANNNGAGGPGGSANNELKTRFFENEEFSALYEAEYDRLENLIFGQDWALDKINDLAELFTEYNSEYQIIDQATYDAGVETIRNYVISRQK